jgi:hypothetical protein
VFRGNGKMHEDVVCFFTRICVPLAANPTVKTACRTRLTTPVLWLFSHEMSLSTYFFIGPHDM